MRGSRIGEYSTNVDIFIRSIDMYDIEAQKDIYLRFKNFCHVFQVYGKKESNKLQI